LTTSRAAASHQPRCRCLIVELRSALRTTLTRIHFPLLGKCGDILVAGKVTSVSLLERGPDLADLPSLFSTVRSDGFSGGTTTSSDLSCRAVM